MNLVRKSPKRRDTIIANTPIRRYIPKMDTNGRGQCPFCGKRHVLHADGKTAFKCDSCMARGDVVDLFAASRGMTEDEAIDLLSMQVAVESAPDAPPEGMEVRDITSAPIPGADASDKIDFV